MNIPDEVLTAPEYMALFASEKILLIDLYLLFGDCDRFSINLNRPQDYRQSPGASIGRKLQRLIDTKLIVIDSKIKLPNDAYQRLFRFRFPLFEIA